MCENDLLATRLHVSPVRADSLPFRLARDPPAVRQGYVLVPIGFLGAVQPDGARAAQAKTKIENPGREEGRIAYTRRLSASELGVVMVTFMDPFPQRGKVVIMAGRG